MDPKKKAKQIMEGIKVKVQAIEGTDHTITTIKTDILDAISKINKFTRKKTTIGLFGRTGEGKSSLLNAVLGEQFLLPSGGFGACTAVITQVEANLNDNNYIAEIDLISKQEWENEVALLKNNDDGENKITETNKEKKVAVYGDDAEEKTLEELKRDDKYAHIDIVLSSEKKTISHHNVSEFTREVVQYIKNDTAKSGGSYWPLVKSVTIKIPNCRELLEHIVLIDIPGTGDCNKIRDDLWKTKLKECSSVWIVSDIKRAGSVTDPWQILEHCIQDLEGGGECKHISFICTKTDDIKPEEFSEKELLESEEITGSKVQKCILYRNKRTKEKLEGKLKKSKSKDSKKRFITDVFTVSSREFFEAKILESEETELPKLKNLLMNLNKNINQELTRDHNNKTNGVLSLIKSVQLDANEYMTKASVQNDLQNILQKALNRLNGSFDPLYKVLETCLSKGVEDSEKFCVKTTSDMILTIRPENNQGFHKIYRAMCVRQGYYLPPHWDAPFDLNKYLTKHMYDNINEEFNLMFPVNDIDKTDRSMQAQLDEFSIIPSVSQTSAWQQHFENFIKTKETKLKASLNRVIVEKKKEIYSSIYETIKEEMSPGYKKAADVKGKESMQKMEHIITETIEQLKLQIFNKAKVQALGKFNKLKLHIMKTLESGLMRTVEQTEKMTLWDVSREIQELEGLSA